MTTFKKLLLLAPLALLLVPASASAETTGPQWSVSSVSSYCFQAGWGCWWGCV